MVQHEEKSQLKAERQQEKGDWEMGRERMSSCMSRGSEGSDNGMWTSWTEGQLGMPECGLGVLRQERGNRRSPQDGNASENTPGNCEDARLNAKHQVRGRRPLSSERHKKWDDSNAARDEFRKVNGGQEWRLWELGLLRTFQSFFCTSHFAIGKILFLSK